MIIISPSKNLNLNDEVLKINHSLPSFLTESRQLTQKIKTLNIDEIKSLMNISDSLAKLNFDRFKNISKKSNIKKAAGFLFSGDTFNGLAIRSLGSSCLTYAQKRLRILSGLYGILKPFDLIEPYRLEMGTKLETSEGKNLYEFWGNKVQDNVLEELKNQKSDLLINLASKEYFTVLGKLPEDVNVVTPTFKDYKNGKFKIISFYAKKARGMMARWIIENKITDFEKLSGFNVDGYKYSKAESTATMPVFLRKA